MKSASSCLLPVKHGCLSRAKGGRHFQQISHAASGANGPPRSGPEGGILVCYALEKLDL